MTPNSHGWKQKFCNDGTVDVFLTYNWPRLGPYGRPLGQQLGHLGPLLEPWKHGFGPYAPKATPGIVGPLLGGGLFGHGLGFPPIGFGPHPFSSHFSPYPISHLGMMPTQLVHGLRSHEAIHQCHGDDGCCTPGRPCGRNEVTLANPPRQPLFNHNLALRVLIWCTGWLRHPPWLRGGLKVWSW